MQGAEEDRGRGLAGLRDRVVQLGPGGHDDEPALDGVLLVARGDAVVGLKPPFVVAVSRIQVGEHGLVDELLCFWWWDSVRDREQLLGSKA